MEDDGQKAGRPGDGIMPQYTLWQRGVSSTLGGLTFPPAVAKGLTSF